MKKISTLILVLSLNHSWAALATTGSKNFGSFLWSSIEKIGLAMYMGPSIEFPIISKEQLIERIKEQAKSEHYERIFRTLSKQNIVTKEEWLNFVEEHTKINFVNKPEIAKFVMQYLNIARLKEIFKERPNLHAFYVKEGRTNRNFRSNLSLLSEIYATKLPKKDSPEKVEQKINKYIKEKGRTSREQYSEHVPENMDGLV